jgi:hypothetical protein
MDVERIIDEIEQLQEIFEAADIRPLSAGDLSAANRRHDEKQATLDLAMMFGPLRNVACTMTVGGLGMSTGAV